MSEVEVRCGADPARVVTLIHASYAIGSDGDSVDIVLDDSTVSGLHVLLERVGAAWLLRDVGSRNGTRLNGERVDGQRRLRDGDEIIAGRSRILFRDRAGMRRPATDRLATPPANLTRMERRTLVELCRPLLSHNAFQPPASVREIAARLFVGKNAVQAHLTSLYGKFDIPEGGDRRVHLANEALQRGAVSLIDLTAPSDETGSRG